MRKLLALGAVSLLTAGFVVAADVAFDVGVPQQLGTFLHPVGDEVIEEGTIGMGVNATGTVVGLSERRDPFLGTMYTAVRSLDGARPESLATLSDWKNVQAVAVSDNGIVVGYGYHPAASTGFLQQGAVMWDASGNFVPLPTYFDEQFRYSSSNAQAISPNGRFIAGYAVFPDNLGNATRWDGPTSATALETPCTGCSGAFATGVNDAGVVVGFAYDPSKGTNRPVKWVGTAGHVLPMPDGIVLNVFSSARAISVTNDGAVYASISTADADGNLTWHALRWAADAAETVTEIATSVSTDANVVAVGPSALVLLKPCIAASCSYQLYLDGSRSSPWGSDVTYTTVSSSPSDGTTGRSYLAGWSTAGTLTQMTRTLVTTTATEPPPPPPPTNQAPEVSLPPSVTTNEGTPVTVMAMVTDNDGPGPLTYEWDLDNNGTFETTSAASDIELTPPDNGSYVVRFRAHDAAGAMSAVVQTTINAENVSPLVQGGDDLTAFAGVPVSLGALFTDAGTRDEPWSYRVTWGDNSDASTGAATPHVPIAPSHSYAVPGTYEVTITVTDKDNGAGTATLHIRVSNRAPVADAGGSGTPRKYSGNEGSSISFDGSRSSDADGDALTYAWDFGDGAHSTGAMPSHAYGDNGSYTATLTVTDSYGSSATASVEVVIANIAPQVQAGGDLTGNVGAPVTIGARFTDPGVRDASWSYNVSWGDNSPASTGTATPDAEIAPSHSYAAPGTYDVTISVADKDHGIGTGVLHVTIVNRAPVADAGGSGSPRTYSGAEGSAISFNGSLSSDPDGDAMTYAWDFGDGTQGAGATASHAYDDNGSYTATLTVTDAHGSKATASVPVNVANVAPVVEAGADLTASVGALVTLGGHFTDPGTQDGAWSYRVIWGDNSQPSTGSATPSAAIAPSHSYATAGTYEVTVTVTDKDNGIGTGTLHINVTVVNRAPVADAGGSGTPRKYSGNEGSAISFDGTRSSDPDGDALTYVWNFGDGRYGIGATQMHTYDDNGSYTATLTVTDAAGVKASASVPVDVANVAPTLGEIIGAPTEPVVVGTSVTLSASFTDPGLRDTHIGSIQWDNLSGFTSVGVTTLSPTATRAGSISTTGTLDAGVYTVLLRVEDKDHGMDEQPIELDYIVVYDPTDGFVTGGGWIWSPVGACRLTSLCSNLQGKATFGFVSKYQKGATVPSGNTEFQFQTGNFRFSSTAYEWLVVNGAKAQYKGTGKVNGGGDYGFMLTAVDGELDSNGKSPDKFRIKIWNKATGAIVYDNQMGQSDNSNAATVLAGGSIQIHK